MTKSEIAEARSEAMMRLQSEFVRVIEKHEPAMLHAQGDEQDVRIVTHDFFNTLANVAIGHLDRRANKAEFKGEIGMFAAGAASFFKEFCQKTAFYIVASESGKCGTERSH